MAECPGIQVLRIPCALRKYVRTKDRQSTGVSCEKPQSQGTCFWISLGASLGLSFPSYQISPLICVLPDSQHCFVWTSNEMMYLALGMLYKMRDMVCKQESVAG